MERRIITTELATEETRFKQSLRPQRLQEYIGQKKLKSMLRVYIDAARQRRESLDHVLFYGPPGLGKTTFSGIIANEIGVHTKITLGPTIEKPGDMVTILNHLQEGDALFADEMHRLNRQVGEVSYPAMEDSAIDIVPGKESDAKNIHLALPYSTLVGATTRTGLLSAPFRDRFGVVQRLGFYEQDELQKIVLRSAKVFGIEIDAAGSAEIARRSRGIPRLANRLLRCVRDFAEVKYSGAATEIVARGVLNLLDVDTCGLDVGDRTVLNLIIDMFHGGPVGLDTLTVAPGEDASTLEEVYEPYLLMQGFLIQTLRGRVVTEYAYSHLNRKEEDEEQADA